MTRFINTIEEISLRRAVFLAAGWIFLRIFFEGVLEAGHRIGYTSFSYTMLLTYFVHFPLFYICLFLLLVLLISTITREKIERVTGAASAGLGSLLLVPLIDWFLHRGYLITYPVRAGPYLTGFLDPFTDLSRIGVSPGQRITIFLIAALTGIYGYYKKRSILRALALFAASLAVIVLFGGLTTILSGNQPENVFITGGILFTDTQKYGALYTVLFAAIVFIYLSRLETGHTRATLRAARPERMIFYGAMAVFGLGVSVANAGISFTPGVFNHLGVVMIFLSMVFGFWCLQGFNDIFDTGIDRIGGRNNPLLSGVPAWYHNSFCILLAALALCGALVVNFSAFLIMTAYLLLGVVYSMPPVRLKRVPVIATMTIAVAVCLSMGFGYSVYHGGRALNAIPGRILYPTLIAVTLGFTAKDIGHAAADRAGGVLTLPVLFYDRQKIRGRVPIALLISLSYLVYALFLPPVLPGAAICAASTLLYTLLVKETRESFYFAMLFLFGGYLFYTLLTILPL
ncbi:UbiA family prenyltransferase [candidate division WOR-3 bacterium]|nr:UbiA family prenyltransferase [candidate division WOR-3 bacterium]